MVDVFGFALSGVMNARSRRALSALLLATGFSITAGCAAPPPGGFALYLTADNVPPSHMAALSHVELAGEPLISGDDVVTYDAGTHEMTLTVEAYRRIVELAVPISGTSFVACVDRNPVYWGAFWTPVSSLSFDGVTVLQPLSPEDTATITIGLGFPSASFHRGEDPRDAPDVLAALERAGKLTGVPPRTVQSG
jgi:hypothetical protein